MAQGNHFSLDVIQDSSLQPGSSSKKTFQILLSIFNQLVQGHELFAVILFHAVKFTST